MRIAGGSHTHLTKRIKQLSIDTSHFKGQGHARGTISTRRLPASLILINRTFGSRQHAHKLRRALLEIGRPYCCEKCGISSWQEQKLILEIDHKNRNWLDDRQENLRFLCPNCHSQT